MLTPIGGGSTFTVSYDDADGPGGADPVVGTIQLTASTSYNVRVTLTNKTTSPFTDVTAEVAEEAEAHRLYYLPNILSGISVTGLDTDADAVPLGLNAVWNTGGAGNGKIRIVLRHYAGTPPGKASTDTVEDPKSATDLDVEFDTTIL